MSSAASLTETSNVLKRAEMAATNLGISLLDSRIRSYVESDRVKPNSATQKVIEDALSEAFELNQDEDGDDSDCDPLQLEDSIRRVATGVARDLTVWYEEEIERLQDENAELKKQLENERKRVDDLQRQLNNRQK